MSIQIQALQRISAIATAVAETAAPNQFRYAMTNRPVSIGACPKDFVGVEDRPPRSSIHYDMARNGVAVYDRKLTDAETKNFEMAPMIDNNDKAALKEYVEYVMDGFGEYASRYAEMAEGKPERFKDEVFSKLKSKVKGYLPSLDIENLAKLVLKEIG